MIFAVMLVLMALRTPIAIAMFAAGCRRLRDAGGLARRWPASSTPRPSPASRATT
jgi:hypothetical protein